MIKCLIELSDDSTGLGDILVIMPYLEKFRTHYGYDVYFMIKNHKLSELFLATYPNIKIISVDHSLQFDKKIKLSHNDHTLPLQKIFATQLGFFDPPYIRPTVDVIDCNKPIKNKYICISTHSTSQLKHWNHPNGKRDHIFSSNWNNLCKMLRKSGYTPVCVDFHKDFGVSPFYNFVPTQSVKKLGLQLTEVIKIIKHCEFFIGLSSGLTWLAHAVGKPVCMISNFTEDWHEIELSTKDYIRITNKNVCHGCWNLVGKEFDFDYEDWYWCPKHKNTERQFECHTSITPEMVFEKIKIWMD
jgi:autotransporter strand-loop-strand O-heptosyltransferase